MNNNQIKITSKIKEAIQNNKPIVALESTLISHGLPYPDNISVANESIKAVEESGSMTYHQNHWILGCQELRNML